MTTALRSLALLACLLLAGPVLAQNPPPMPPAEPPPVLDPAQPPPVLDPAKPPMDDGRPIEEAVAMPSRSDSAAQLDLDRARLSCESMPEQQRQSCLDAAQRAYEQAQRRDDDPVR
jgi:hypothetical protein